MEEHHVVGTTFVGEQDGEPERELKRALADVLSGFPSIKRAYLAQIQYRGCEEICVALCICGTPENMKIVEACSRPFQELFNSQEYLDVLFISSEQESTLAKVCKAFYGDTER